MYLVLICVLVLLTADHCVLLTAGTMYTTVLLVMYYTTDVHSAGHAHTSVHAVISQD